MLHLPHVEVVYSYRPLHTTHGDPRSLRMVSFFVHHIPRFDMTRAPCLTSAVEVSVRTCSSISGVLYFEFQKRKTFFIISSRDFISLTVSANSKMSSAKARALTNTLSTWAPIQLGRRSKSSSRTRLNKIGDSGWPCLTPRRRSTPGILFGLDHKSLVQRYFYRSTHALLKLFWAFFAIA